MKNVVLTDQEENWEDDGGDHDCYALEVSEDDFDILSKWNTSDPIPRNRFNQILNRSRMIKEDEFPIMIHATFNIWIQE